MADSVRNVAQLAVGGLAFAVGGPLAFAVSQVAFNFLVPPKAPKTAKGARTLQQEKNTAVGTAIFEVYGKWEREGGDLIRCAKDRDGVRSGILVITKEEKQGGSGGSGLSTGAQKVSKDYQYLQASFALCAGPARVDRVIEVNGTDGEKVVYLRGDTYNNRGGWRDNTDYEVDDTVTKNNKRYLCKEAHHSSYNLDPGDDSDDSEPTKNWRTYWTRIGDKKSLLDFVPIRSALSGEEIGLMSETLRLYYGTEEQPTDSAEMSWYDDGVSADRGICKAVFNKYGPLESGTTFKFLLSAGTGNRREIIRSRMQRAGVPASRIDLRSIPADAADYGWAVEGREAARTLCENVAAMAFHDLHFMATANGMCFTDVSQSNPTVFVVPDALLGAYSNTSGDGAPISTLNGTIQSGETKPRELSAEFVNLNRNYKDESVVAQWHQGQGEPQSVSFKLVSDVEQMGDWVEVAMRAIQSVNGTGDVSLMPALSQVACGCALDLGVETQDNPFARKLFRVVSQAIAPDGALACTLAPYDPSVYEPVPLHPVTVEPPPQVFLLGMPRVLILDTANVSDETIDEPYALMVGYCDADDNWGGATVSSSSGAFADVELPFRGKIGKTVTAYNYSPFDTAYFDYQTTLRVNLDYGELVSASEDDVRNGANVLYIRGAFVAFVTATPLGNGTYDLKGLLPGLLGTDFVGNFPVGSRVVKMTDHTGALEPSVKPVKWTRRFLNREGNYRVFSARDTTISSDDMTCALTGENLRALSVSPWITRGSDGSGGYILKFFGRSRYPSAGEDYWQAGFPVRHADPLSWTVRLKSGSAILDERVVSSLDAEVSVNYTQSELTAIYGSVPAKLNGEVFQNGTYGSGRARPFNL